MVSAPPTAKPSFPPSVPSHFSPSFLPFFGGAGRCNFSHFLLYCIGQMRCNGMAAAVAPLCCCCGTESSCITCRPRPAVAVAVPRSVLRPACVSPTQTDRQTDRQTDSRRDPSSCLFFFLLRLQTPCRRRSVGPSAIRREETSVPASNAIPCLSDRPRREKDK